MTDEGRPSYLKDVIVFIPSLNPDDKLLSKIGSLIEAPTFYEHLSAKRNLEKTLHERVIGQNEAVEAVAKAIRRGRVGW